MHHGGSINDCNNLSSFVFFACNFQRLEVVLVDANEKSHDQGRGSLNFALFVESAELIYDFSSIFFFIFAGQ